MLPVKVSLILLGTLSVSLAGSLEERWFKDLKKAQESYKTGQADSSSFNSVPSFQTKKFETSAFPSPKNTTLEKSVFSTKDFNSGKTNDLWSSQKFTTASNSTFNRKSSAISTDQTFATGSSSLGGERVIEDKKAREDGVEAVLDREKSVLSDMRYQGVEAQKVAQEIKLINDTLKNKEDLKDHKISIKEIREILNKN